jgi:hypothetical protein
VTSDKPVAANVAAISASGSVRRLTRRSAIASPAIDAAWARSIAAPIPSDSPLDAAAVVTTAWSRWRAPSTLATAQAREPAGRPVIMRITGPGTTSRAPP